MVLSNNGRSAENHLQFCKESLANSLLYAVDHSIMMQPALLKGVVVASQAANLNLMPGLNFAAVPASSSGVTAMSAASSASFSNFAISSLVEPFPCLHAANFLSARQPGSCCCICKICMLCGMREKSISI